MFFQIIIYFAIFAKQFSVLFSFFGRIPLVMDRPILWFLCHVQQVMAAHWWLLGANYKETFRLFQITWPDFAKRTGESEEKKPTYTFLTTGGKMTVQKPTYSSLVRFFFPPLHHGLVHIAQRVPSFAVLLRLAPIEVERQRMQNVWALQREDRMFPNCNQNRTKNTKTSFQLISTDDCLEKMESYATTLTYLGNHFSQVNSSTFNDSTSSTLQPVASRP